MYCNKRDNFQPATNEFTYILSNGKDGTVFQSLVCIQQMKRLRRRLKYITKTCKDSDCDEKKNMVMIGDLLNIWFGWRKKQTKQNINNRTQSTVLAVKQLKSHSRSPQLLFFSDMRIIARRAIDKTKYPSYLEPIA